MELTAGQVLWYSLLFGGLPGGVLAVGITVVRVLRPNWTKEWLGLDELPRRNIP